MTSRSRAILTTQADGAHTGSEARGEHHVVHGAMIRTQVGIVGAGPSGLILAHMLRLRGIESVILEARSREYCEQRVRAGVLEHDAAALLEAIGVGERMRREGLIHRGIYLRFGCRDHHIDFTELTGGRAITVYGQREVIRDLIGAALADGQPLLFEVDDVELSKLDSAKPTIRFGHDGRAESLQCDIVAGCDGFHGVCRPSIPSGVLSAHEKQYPFAWLGILAEAAPASDELIYTRHERGFALLSMRSPSVTRLYVQCAADERIEDWSDDQIWDELRTRFTREDPFTLNEGPIVQRGITPMRSFVAEPMQFGRLFLVGDAAHIVPPTGAKGMNLAIADVRVLVNAMTSFFERGSTRDLDQYSATCLRRVWKVQRFSDYMTRMLHRTGDPFADRVHRAELDYVASSRAAATALAENYVGLPFDDLAS
jgi:p-hydroxybenzoate 3-monooxygenase